MIMGIVASQALSASPPVGASFRYWRVFITETNQPSSIRASISEMQLRGTVGGLDLTSPVAAETRASASSFQDSGEAFRAFNDNPDDGWASLENAALPQWLRYDFGIETTVAQVALTSGSNETRVSRMPISFVIQGSNDSLTWMDLLTQVDVPAWAISETRAYTL